MWVYPFVLDFMNSSKRGYARTLFFLCIFMWIDAILFFSLGFMLMPFIHMPPVMYCSSGEFISSVIIGYLRNLLLSSCSSPVDRVYSSVFEKGTQYRFQNSRIFLSKHGFSF